MHLEIIAEVPETNTRPSPVLFVHGMWTGAWCWAETFLPYFCRHGYASYAVSLRGHGASDGRDRLRWTSLDDYVTDVLQVAGEMETPPILIGHSMGGVVVQKTLETLRSPAGVLLASGPPSGLLPATLRVFVRHPWAVTKANLTLSMLPVVGTPELAKDALFSASVPKEHLARTAAQLQDESYRAYLDMLGLSLPHPKRVQTPLLVLGAAEDTILSEQDVRATARTYGADIEILPAMAHGMVLETSWQTLADRILSWLELRGL